MNATLNEIKQLMIDLQNNLSQYNSTANNNITNLNKQFNDISTRILNLETRYSILENQIQLIQKMLINDLPEQIEYPVSPKEDKKVYDDDDDFRVVK